MVGTNRLKPAVTKNAYNKERMLSSMYLKTIIKIKNDYEKRNILTDLSEIYQAAKERRGYLLIVNDHFHQAVKVTGDFSLDLVTDATLPGVIGDITSDIAWDVISKKGRAIFTTKEELKSLGDIVLKVRC